MSKLPFVSSNIPRDLRAFVDRVKEILSDTGNGRLVTADELIRRGIAGKDTDGQLVPTTPDEEPELGTPPAPTNLQASGALASIILSWDAPVYFGHAYTEVWGASTDNLGAAVLLGSSPGATYVDTTGANTTRYYWVRFVNRENTIGPYNATGGTLGQTGQDPAYLLELLTGEITESQLYSELGDRIDLIDAAATVPNSVAARVQAEATARAQAILDEANARTLADNALQTQINTLAAASTGDLADLIAVLEEEQTARIAGDTAEAAARETLAAQVRGSYTGTDVNALTTGLIYNERVARAAQDSAIASSVSALSSTVTNNYNTLNSAITTEQTTRASADTALTTSISNLSATVSSNFTTLSANISSEEQARVSADNALSSSINTVSATANAKNRTYYQTSAPATGLVVGDIWFDTDDNRKAYRWDGSVWQATDDARIAANAAAIVSEATARANADTANATATQQVQARLDTGDFAAVKAESSVNASKVTGLEAKYTVKIDNNGYVTGFGLASTANDAVPFSEFAVRADNFYIASPSGPGIAPSLPFIVRTTPTTINGVTVPVGVYITDGFIQNGTITNAKIGNAAIDDAKIASVTAGKITAGSIGVGEYIQSSNYIAGSQGWRINGNGFAEFGAASIRGQLVASQIDTRNLTIKDAAGNILFGAGTSISTANISGLGALATQNTVSTSQVTGLGTLATQNSVNWNTQLTNIPAFGGFAYINTITSANISTYIQGAAIGTAYIADGAITNALIANAAISSAKIGDGEITNAKIANAAITAAKIEDAAITSAKIGNLQVQSANIAELTVGTNKITNNAITDTASASLSSTVLANEPISYSNLNWKDVLTLTYTIQENNSLVQIVPSFELVDGTVVDGSSGDSTVTYLRGPQVRLILGAATYAATTKIFSGVSAGSYTVKLQIAADFFVNSFIGWDPLPGVTNSTLFVVEYKK